MSTISHFDLTLRENPATLSKPLLSHLKYREISKINHEHFSQKFTPLSNGHYHFVKTPRPHVFISMFYLLLLLTVLFALIAAIDMIDESQDKTRDIRRMRTSKVMTKTKNAADRKTATARLLARRKRRTVDFRARDSSFEARLHSANTENGVAEQPEAGAETLIFAERINVAEEATVAGNGLGVDFQTPLVEPSSVSATINRSDHGSHSGSDTKRAVELTDKPDDGDRTHSSIYKTDDVHSPKESGEDKIADISSETKETRAEAGFNKDSELNAEPSIGSIPPSAADSTDANQAGKDVEPEKDVHSSPSGIITLPLIDLTGDSKNADPKSEDRKETDPKPRTTDATSTQDNSPPPQVSLEYDDGTGSDPSTDIGDSSVSSQNTKSAIVNASAMLPPPLPGGLYTRERSPQRKFVGLHIAPPQADLGIEAISVAAVGSASSGLTEDDGSRSEGTAADGTTFSESDAPDNEVSNPAASKAEIEVLRGSENTERRSTVGAIPGTTNTKDTAGIPESNRRSMGATRSGRSTLRYSFNPIPHSAHTPDWDNKISWTLNQMQKRKDSEEAGSGEPENNVKEVPKTHTPSSAFRVFDHKIDSPILSLRERMAQRSNVTNTVMPSPNHVGLRRGTLSGRRTNILGDSPRTGIAAPPSAERASLLVSEILSDRRNRRHEALIDQATLGQGLKKCLLPQMTK